MMLYFKARFSSLGPTEIRGNRFVQSLISLRGILLSMQVIAGSCARVGMWPKSSAKRSGDRRMMKILCMEGICASGKGDGSL
jgi:hypothetical protein